MKGEGRGAPSPVPQRHASAPFFRRVRNRVVEAALRHLRPFQANPGRLAFERRLMDLLPRLHSDPVRLVERLGDHTGMSPVWDWAPLTPPSARRIIELYPDSAREVAWRIRSGLSKYREQKASPAIPSSFPELDRTATVAAEAIIASCLRGEASPFFVDAALPDLLPFPGLYTRSWVDSLLRAFRSSEDPGICWFLENLIRKMGILLILGPSSAHQVLRGPLPDTLPDIPSVPEAAALAGYLPFLDWLLCWAGEDAALVLAVADRIPLPESAILMRLLDVMEGTRSASGHEHLIEDRERSMAKKSLLCLLRSGRLRPATMRTAEITRLLGARSREMREAVVAGLA